MAIVRENLQLSSYDCRSIEKLLVHGAVGSCKSAFSGPFAMHFEHLFWDPIKLLHSIEVIGTHAKELHHPGIHLQLEQLRTDLAAAAPGPEIQNTQKED
jgi:hypothetical protein